MLMMVKVTKLMMMVMMNDAVDEAMHIGMAHDGSD